MSEAATDLIRPRLMVSVDLNRCQGYAQCCYAAPGQFRIRGREALFYDPSPPAETAVDVERARVACPVKAIRVVSDGVERR